MDFGALPPEINSLRMYSGPGSAPMLAAMTAWDEVAAEMHLAATAYDSIISTLISDGWLGSASTAMAASVAPYVTWMSLTSMQAAQTAHQAAASAAAFEAAFAMTVPPAVIAANRARLMVLVATNFFGINTPAIAATEAEYLEMWAQDATAMYAYAAVAAEAASLMPFTEPAQTTNPSGQSGQAAAVTQAVNTAAGNVTQTQLPHLMSAVPAALQELASPAEAFPGEGLLVEILDFLDGSFGNAYGVFLNSNLVNGFTSAGYVAPALISPAVTDAIADIAGIAQDAQVVNDIPVLGPDRGDVAWTPAIVARSGLGGVAGSMNQATLVGRLSVPPSWAAAVDVVKPGASALPAAGIADAAAEAGAGVPGVPGMPGPGMYARHYGNGPKYGFQPRIMGRPPAAG
ncbi:PPE family protein [Mycobacterium intermedium]|uniref:PPE family protein n=1 Tax=Mycobacterium intermedium TaxID=28445 RepID=A0A1E3SJZ7_MYCIE|nr:PPE family protein [Mycobacterium intermedium]MCV6964406.1 PPE family protein [Mycobacterium intermedium]ODR01888.1 hypothetical protein BHQ20_07155 [Mycobacterium intermedium]OPE49500.1 PPE family protein [Mycobacterium intermedium]ORB08618.1 PPE family protein [Mycobacterium intermedium]